MGVIMKTKVWNEWVLVRDPETDNEDIVADFPLFSMALRAQKEFGEGDIMKRLADGTLTTEY